MNLDNVDDEQADDVVGPDDDDVHHPQTAKVLPKGILEEGKGDFRQTMQAAETTVYARLFVHTVARPASREKMKHPMTTDTNSSRDGAMDVNM